MTGELSEDIFVYAKQVKGILNSAGDEIASQGNLKG